MRVPQSHRARAKPKATIRPAQRGLSLLAGYRGVVAHLLLVEDDAEIRRALIRALTDRGHAVASEASGMKALAQIVDHAPDLVVLDLGLPDVSGEDLLRMIRSVSRVPVIAATARGDEAVIVRILELGADDYVIKPFGPAQLDARIKAVLRRAGTGEPATPEPRVVGELRIDTARRVIKGLPEDTQYKLLRGNAERLYRFTPAEPPARAA